jgi:DNA processing protein
MLDVTDDTHPDPPPRSPSSSEHLHWLALLRIPGMGPVHLRALLDRYGDPRQVFERAAWDDMINKSLSAAAAQWLADPDWKVVEADARWAEDPDHHLLTLNDPRYPPLLKQIHDAPPVLFVRGNVAALQTPQLAIVGSRNPTVIGSDTARRFAAELARTGITVTSGLAIGIDAAAHRGALEAGGYTIAVSATGPDGVYPASHRDLAREISRSGAVISEFPPGSPPLRESFPRRNRVISGLSAGTLVVEAAIHSGSLITARAALDQGREVFAIPGSIHNARARGCHFLLRQGAKLVECIGDIFDELPTLARSRRASGGSCAAVTSTAAPNRIDETAAHVLDSIDFAPTTMDVIMERTGLSVGQLYRLLLDLELHDLIVPVAGGAYVRRPAARE